MHVAVFTWREDVNDAKVDDLDRALDGMAHRIECLVSYSRGRDLGLRKGNGDYAVVAQVDNEHDLSAYLDHPAHHEVLDTHLSKMIASRVAVQFEVPV